MQKIAFFVTYHPFADILFLPKNHQFCKNLAFFPKQLVLGLKIALEFEFAHSLKFDPIFQPWLKRFWG